MSLMMARCCRTSGVSLRARSSRISGEPSASRCSPTPPACRRLSMHGRCCGARDPLAPIQELSRAHVRRCRLAEARGGCLSAGTSPARAAPGICPRATPASSRRGPAGLPVTSAGRAGSPLRTARRGGVTTHSRLERGRCPVAEEPGRPGQRSRPGPGPGRARAARPGRSLQPLASRPGGVVPAAGQPAGRTVHIRRAFCDRLAESKRRARPRSRDGGRRIHTQEVKMAQGTVSGSTATRATVSSRPRAARTCSCTSARSPVAATAAWSKGRRSSSTSRRARRDPRRKTSGSSADAPAGTTLAAEEIASWRSGRRHAARAADGRVTRCACWSPVRTQISSDPAMSPARRPAVLGQDAREPAAGA